MSTRLGTAIYNSHRDSKYGGRCWEEQYYFSSLQNIMNFDLPIVIFCDDNGYDKINNFMRYLEGTGIKNKWKVIKQDLGKFKFEELIVDHRKKQIERHVKIAEERKKTNPDEPGFFHARCEILCHKKIYYVKEVAELNPYNTENFCWIDTGITHWALTPFSKGGVEINNFFDINHYYPRNKNNIYTPEIGKGIDKIITDHGMFELKHGNIWYSKSLVDLLVKFLSDEYGLPWEEANLKHQLVGGLIGLQPKEFDELFKFYEKALTYLCSAPPEEGDLFTEEIILSAYYKFRKFFTIDFHDWPHDGVNDPAYVDYGRNKPDRDGRILFYEVWDIIKKYNKD